MTQLPVHRVLLVGAAQARYDPLALGIVAFPTALWIDAGGTVRYVQAMLPPDSALALAPACPDHGSQDP